MRALNSKLIEAGVRFERALEKKAETEKQVDKLSRRVTFLEMKLKDESIIKRDLESKLSLKINEAALLRRRMSGLSKQHIVSLLPTTPLLVANPNVFRGVESINNAEGSVSSAH